MRVWLLGFLGVVATACGGGAPATGPGGRSSTSPSGAAANSATPAALTAAAANIPIAKASRGVAPPAQPKAQVTATPKSVSFAIGPQAPIVMTIDTDQDQLVTAVQGQLPAAAPCLRGEKPTSAVKSIIARVESPAPTDAVVVADATRPSTGLTGMMALLAYPTVIAVRDATSDELRVLPLRFCAVYTDSPAALPSAIEVANTGRGVVAVPSGGFERSGVRFMEPGLPAAEMAAQIGRVAQGAEIQTVRISTHSEVTISELIAELEAALAAKTREVIVVLERHEPDLLETRMTALRVSGGVPNSHARSEVVKRMDSLRACYVRAAFVDPKLGAQKLTLKAGVNAVGGLSVSAGENADAMTKCAATALAGITIPRVTAPGIIEIDLALSRTNPQDAVRGGDSFHSLHGTGP